MALICARCSWPLTLERDLVAPALACDGCGERRFIPPERVAAYDRARNPASAGTERVMADRAERIHRAYLALRATGHRVAQTDGRSFVVGARNRVLAVLEAGGPMTQGELEAASGFPPQSRWRIGQAVDDLVTSGELRAVDKDGVIAYVTRLDADRDHHKRYSRGYRAGASGRPPASEDPAYLTGYRRGERRRGEAA